MTDPDAERWQATIRVSANAMAELSKRIAQVIHTAQVPIAAAWLIMQLGEPADRERLVRHLAKADDPCGRALYIVSQVRRGCNVAMME